VVNLVAYKEMWIGKFTISKWVKQYHEERAAKFPKATPMTPEQLKIRDLEKQI
jgi:transposase